LQHNAPIANKKPLTFTFSHEGLTNARIIIILTHGFVKKTQKVPKNEIEKAIAYKDEFLNNGGWKR